MRALSVTVGLCLVVGCFSDLKRASDGPDTGLDQDTGTDGTDASDGSTSDAEAGTDPSDGGHDAEAGIDASSDAQMDATPDAEAGITLEAGSDAPSDAPVDAPVDAPSDPDGGTDGGSVRMELLTVSRAGTSEASGRVVDNASTIDCGGDCTHSYALGTTVTLTARNINGSNTTFTGWTGSCAAFGLQRTCTLVMNAPRTVSARFEPLEHNLVFITSVAVSPSSVGITGYDQYCNQRASAIGVNNSAGDGFIAWVATSDNLPSERLGSARGFVRIDGLAFSDRVSDLLQPISKIWNPIVFNELGVRAMDYSDFLVLTGVRIDGSVVETCGDWSTSSGFMTYGAAHEGPGWWSHSGGASGTECMTPRRLVCIQHMFENPILTPPSSVSGNIKRMFLSKQPFVPGGGINAADALCDSAGEKPSGAGTYKALLSTLTTPAAAVLDDAVLYVSPQLQAIGTGAAIKLRDDLSTGIWQHGDNTFNASADMAWTGSSSPMAVGTNETTCHNWTSSSGTSTGIFGRSLTTQGTIYWQWTDGIECNTPAHLYCVEQ